MKSAFPDSFLARRCIPVLVAVGGSLAASPASALELGDLTVHSKLGQPLRANIAYALGPHEQLSDFCISLRPGRFFSGLANVTRASVSVANGVIRLTGSTPIREPMISAQIAVNCPYAAKVSREYTFFIDPATRVYAPPVTAAVRVSTASRQATVQHDVEKSTRHEVQPGDSLAAIVQRIGNRPVAVAEPDPEPSVIPTTAVEPEITPVAAVPDKVLAEFMELGVTTGDLKPGDFILDTQLAEPVTKSTSPNVPTAIIRSAAAATNDAQSASWLAWLAGGGVAGVFALWLFGRRLRGGAKPVALLARPSRPSNSDVGDEHKRPDALPEVESLAVDADLIAGTGLAEGSDVDLAKDFGFAQTTALDIELPFETIAPINDANPAVSGETDIIGTLKIDESSILKVEVMPENDDYDMSVIIDATKMPQPEDVSQHDLRAIEASDDSVIIENYTISQEVDYRMVEQDYEDEMTATQALNKEIARAAAEVIDQMDVDDATDINEVLTVSLADADQTAEMPAADNDGDTVEMPAKSGKTG